MNPMVTTNQKLITDTQKLKRKETKHTTKEKSSALNGTKKKKKERERENIRRRMTRTTRNQVVKWQ